VFSTRLTSPRSDSHFTSDVKGMAQTLVDSLMPAARNFGFFKSSIMNLPPSVYWHVNSIHFLNSNNNFLQP
jgi:hypothetical protein